MRLERTIEQYKNGVPEVIVEGSKAQVLFALKDSRHDVLALAELVGDLRDALHKAHWFIHNGIELGFIRMPETEIDPAHKTPSIVATALAKAKAVKL